LLYSLNNIHYQKITLMTFNEKKLYHQIHPLKLLVDISSGFLTTYLSWQHNWFWFLILFVMPSLAISYLLIQFASLKHQKNSSFGKYVQKHMTTNVEAIRFSGQFVMWIGAWYHLTFAVIFGFLLIVGGWCSGLIYNLIWSPEQ